MYIAKRCHFVRFKSIYSVLPDISHENYAIFNTCVYESAASVTIMRPKNVVIIQN